MSLEDRYLALKNDPKKMVRLFKVTWIVAYTMLILGFFLIIYILIYGETL